MSQIELEQVTRDYHDIRAVDDMSLTIDAGELFSLLGPSGSGKTTVLRMVGGFLMPSSGVIRIGGQDVTNLPPERRGLGFVFQNYALFPHLTVFENIAFGLRARKLGGSVVTSRVGSVLEKTGLLGYEKRYPRELSGGEQQRVAVARALVIEPAVLLLDEPLGALDRILREQMQYWLKALQNETKVTTIYVTHDQIEALTLSDRIAVMRQGRVEQVGLPGSLYTNPATRFVASFMGDNNVFDCTVAAQDPTGMQLEATTGLRLVAEPGVHTVGTSVIAAVRPEDIAIQRPDDPPRDANLIPGRVTSKVYRGAVNRYQVDVTASDQQLLVDTNGRVDRFEVGDDVVLSFPARYTSILTSGGNA
jgi:ABC-type Fe3+/spermidine/putrescine transport system ATPase subunit